MPWAHVWQEPCGWHPDLPKGALLLPAQSDAGVFAKEAASEKNTRPDCELLRAFNLKRTLEMEKLIKRCWCALRRCHVLTLLCTLLPLYARCLCYTRRSQLLHGDSVDGRHFLVQGPCAAVPARVSGPHRRHCEDPPDQGAAAKPPPLFPALCLCRLHSAQLCACLRGCNQIARPLS